MKGQILSTRRTPQGDRPSREPKPSDAAPRRLPFGAEWLPGQGVAFRVWAPKSRTVSVQLSSREDFNATGLAELSLEPEESGYFSALVSQARPGMFYKFKLGSGAFPDPASRFQPAGPHGPSQIVDPGAFRWSDPHWRGVSRHGQVIYEMHIGTFTREGTWRAAQEQLPELADLGVTVLEVMPVAEFPGEFGWGYDGVDIFAPTRLYGTPDDFRAFVDRAHQLGLGVLLDVVYNHVGPDGNYLKQFSEDYFTTRYGNEWGEALNFDGPNSRPVREFFSSNAAYWIDEFHLDGLRLDAVHQIFDASPEHILNLLARKAREAAPNRSIYLVAENEKQHGLVARPVSAGGYGVDAVWNDDFHHVARVALSGHNEAYFSDYCGAPQEFISALKHGYLYQGQWYSWQKQRRGTPALDLAPEQFVNCLQNHDQIANSLLGLRLHQLSHPGTLRALTALVLLAPGTPMLFQGQEFAASAPFLYFADHNPELAQLVAQGRRKFLCQFPSVRASADDLAPPHARGTFEACKIDFTERKRHAPIYRLHKDLLRLRREDAVFSQPGQTRLDGAVLGPQVFVLRFFSPTDDRLVVVNLGTDYRVRSMAEPLLAPQEGKAWTVRWSSESVCYGGCEVGKLDDESVWQLPGHTALVLAAEAREAPSAGSGRTTTH
ncbi:MAG TPA: malto-oligosyltrehalose trehalohydrolase [Verrucomicrobiae bacterium]|nr:malto-oligosyltrehalose trehalohydrolase [Verrucomicrobiae bacterium]